MWTRRFMMAALALATSIQTPAEEPFHTRPNCWTEARIHSVPQELGPEVKIERGSGTLATEASLSPNQGYGYSLQKPENSDQRPAKTQLEISVERPYTLRIGFPEALAVEPPTWVNEKLLFVRVWWGRAAGTDFLVDVEKEIILHREPFRSGIIAYQQYQQCASPEWQDTESCLCFKGAPDGWRPAGLQKKK